MFANARFQGMRVVSSINGLFLPEAVEDSNTTAATDEQPSHEFEQAKEALKQFEIALDSLHGGTDGNFGEERGLSPRRLMTPVIA